MPVHNHATRKAYVQGVVGEYLKAGMHEEAERFLEYMEKSFSY